MGSPESDDEASGNEKPQHRVQIRYRLAVGRYPVTFAEWDTYVADGEAGHRPNDEGWGRSRRPVIHVSWEHAQKYVAWLSQKTGQIYRLLSEAEWEYAARGGTTTNRWWGNTLQNANFLSFVHNDMDNMVWRTLYGRGLGKYPFQRWSDCRSEGTSMVGSYPESTFKLYDMLGNIWEWVEDCWNDNYTGAPDDGAAWIAGNSYERVLRGGSWKSNPKDIRSARRRYENQHYSRDDVGFRVARTI